MKKILVTGGCGYIGSHTIVDLLEHGFEVVSVDDFSNSYPTVLDGIEQITGTRIENFTSNLTDFNATKKIFEKHPNIAGIIHFAAFKAVGESVNQPLEYYQNNLSSLINLLQLSVEFGVKNFVFSSSCTVYGNPDSIPVTEIFPMKEAASPYGATKQMGERIIQDLVQTGKIQATLLRYFNPVGAHPSILLGELPIGKPLNLVPVITQTAVGILPEMQVFGNDYPTRDGSCIRDFIHVCDIARDHTLAVEQLMEQRNKVPCEIFNLGTGLGITVLEAIQAFEKVSNVQLPYRIAPRRAGDVVAIYANNEKAKNELGWKIQYDIDAMMDTAWKWQQSLPKES
jgi:UDP-glucose 4-epimerase